MKDQKNPYGHGEDRFFNKYTQKDIYKRIRGQAIIENLLVHDDVENIIKDVLCTVLFKQWVVTRGVRLSHGACTFARLVGARPRDGRFHGENHVEEPPGFDHPTMWVRDGKPAAMVYHTYDMTPELMNNIISFCASSGATPKFFNPSWYNPLGGCEMVEIWAPGVAQYPGRDSK